MTVCETWLIRDGNIIIRDGGLLLCEDVPVVPLIERRIRVVPRERRQFLVGREGRGFLVPSEDRHFEVR